MYETERPDRAPDAQGGTRGLDDPGFTYDVTQDDGRVVVTMHGELDLAAAPALQRELLALVAQPVPALTLDLGALTFLDSSGLGALYRTRQAADEQGITLSLEAVPAHVMRVLDVTAMAPLFGLEPGAA